LLSLGSATRAEQAPAHEHHAESAKEYACQGCSALGGCAPFPEAYTLYRLQFHYPCAEGHLARTGARSDSLTAFVWAIIGYPMLNWDFLVGRGAAVDLGGVAWPILPELPAALAQLCARSVPDTWLVRTTAVLRCRHWMLLAHQGVRPASRTASCMQHVTAPFGARCPMYTPVQLVSEQGSWNVDTQELQLKEYESYMSRVAHPRQDVPAKHADCKNKCAGT